MDQSYFPPKTKFIAKIMTVTGIIYLAVLLTAVIMAKYPYESTVISPMWIRPLLAPVLSIIYYSSILLSPLFYMTPVIILFESGINFINFIFYIFLSILLVLFSHFLLKRKKWAWWGALFVLTANFLIMIRPLLIQTTIVSNNSYLFSLIIFSITLFLLINNRKEYFKYVN